MLDIAAEGIKENSLNSYSLFKSRFEGGKGWEAVSVWSRRVRLRFCPKLRGVPYDVVSMPLIASALVRPTVSIDKNASDNVESRELLLPKHETHLPPTSNALLRHKL